MKKGKYILTLLAAALFAACTDYDVAPDYTVGEDNNAIVLGAGVAEGGNGVMSRAVDGNHAGNASGGAHKTLAEGTKMTLRVDGTWLGKTSYTLPHGSVTDTKATQTTTAKVGTETATDSKHNNVVFSNSEQLYWDDYGTADPANMSPNTGNGRDKGLTIYGVALDTINIAAPVPSDWKVLPWTLAAKQSTGWGAWDLITSNNIRPTTDGGDGTYTFADAKNSTGSNLLEFTHAMSKITVELTAREGFEGWSTATPNAGTFTGAPTVTLKSFKYKGNVSVEAKTSTPDDAVSDITMHLAEGGASSHIATFDAIVFPGNEFNNDTEILTFTADGNTFKATAEKLNDAIENAITNKATTGYPAESGDKKLKQGWNYKIRITVDKTKIKVEATVVDWSEVTADPAHPKISVTESYGIELGDGTGKEPAFTKDFDFFVSEKIASGYDNKAWIKYGTDPEDDTKHTYTMHDQLYWPNHQIHYFFRGVWPRVGTDDQTEINQNYTKKANVDDKDIDVQNVPYTENSFPSDLMIGYPRVAADKTCPHGNKVAEKGICATEGSEIMNFRYAMSQVKVILETTTTGDKVKIDNTTKVEIVNGYTGGSIKLEDGSAVGSTKNKYEMHQESTSAETTTEPAKATYHDAILPQNLTLDSKDLLFRVTIDNGDGTTDVYECPIKDIYVPTGSTTKISAWASGTSYTYTLKLKKTAITAVATITPWTEVEAEENIWF